MNEKILNTKPISGGFSEIHFGKHFTSRLRIELDNNDFETFTKLDG